MSVECVVSVYWRAAQQENVTESTRTRPARKEKREEGKGELQACTGHYRDAFIQQQSGWPDNRGTFVFSVYPASPNFPLRRLPSRLNGTHIGQNLLAFQIIKAGPRLAPTAVSHRFRLVRLACRG